MIAITKVQTLDEGAYNYVHCPQCNNKIGWKSKGARVNIYRLSQIRSGRMEQLGVTCKRCKSHYLIATESD